jgi:hypothetical protein
VRSSNSFSYSYRTRDVRENTVSLLVEEEDKSLGERDFHLTSEAGQISGALRKEGRYKSVNEVG